MQGPMQPMLLVLEVGDGAWNTGEAKGFGFECKLVQMYVMVCKEVNVKIHCKNFRFTCGSPACIKKLGYLRLGRVRFETNGYDLWQLHRFSTSSNQKKEALR